VLALVQENTILPSGRKEQPLIQLLSSLKTIATSIQKFGETVVESMPCELTFDRKKDKQAQLLAAYLSPPMPVENIKLPYMFISMEIVVITS
jgi:hypothetical protein